MTLRLISTPTRLRVAGDLFHCRVPDGARYVGRAAPGLRRSRWANLHRVGYCRVCDVDHDQAAAVRAYAAGITFGDVVEIRRELSGTDLACWCKLGQPCHVDVLLEIANRGRRPADPNSTWDEVEEAEQWYRRASEAE